MLVEVVRRRLYSDVGVHVAVVHEMVYFLPDIAIASLAVRCGRRRRMGMA